MRIASWNVNSIRARLPVVLEVLDEIQCDVVCLQEIKCTTQTFPYAEIEELGYNIAAFGQKSYNGVALLSKYPLSDVREGLPGFEDEQSRYIEAVIEADTPFRVASIYLPNGNPAPGPKYDYKLDWYQHLIDHAQSLLELEERLVLAGDYNTIPFDTDCWDIGVWAEDALARPATREKFRALSWSGFSDAYNLIDGKPFGYTFWDYQGRAFDKDHGIRIDHLMLSAEAADILKKVDIYRAARAKSKPSDHVPVIGEFST